MALVSDLPRFCSRPTAGLPDPRQGLQRVGFPLQHHAERHNHPLCPGQPDPGPRVHREGSGLYQAGARPFLLPWGLPHGPGLDHSPPEVPGWCGPRHWVGWGHPNRRAMVCGPPRERGSHLHPCHFRWHHYLQVRFFKSVEFPQTFHGFDDCKWSEILFFS